LFALSLLGLALFFAGIIAGAVTRTWNRHTWSLRLRDFMSVFRSGPLNRTYAIMLVVGAGALLTFYLVTIAMAVKVFPNVLLPVAMFGFVTWRIVKAFLDAAPGKARQKKGENDGSRQHSET
jgi:hypothetical protein